MAEFRVVWEIDVEAEDPLSAIHEARKLRDNPDTTATIYSVTNNTTGEHKDIDFATGEEIEVEIPF